MRRTLIGLFILGSFGLALFRGADAAFEAAMRRETPTLRAGVAVVDITPPLGSRMAGYFNERVNTGTLDPLQAKALVFAQGEIRMAWVVCDLIGVPLEVSRRARTLASNKTGIPIANIVIAATHAHTGPLFTGPLRDYFHNQAVRKNGRDPHETEDYPALLVEKLIEALAKAEASLKDVRLEAGIAKPYPPLSFNRRFHMKDGTVRFNPGQQNPDIIREAGPIDPEAGMLLIRERDGNRALASWTVFALHCDTVGGTQYSADYPAHLERALRQALGPEFFSIFGAGPCGDINHIDVRTKGRRRAEEIGALLADTLLGAMPKWRARPAPSLAVRREIIDAPLQKYSPDQIAQATQDLAKVGTRQWPFLKQVEACKIVDIGMRGPGATLPLEVQAFRLNSETAVVTLPGEVFVELGLAIKKASPFKTTLVMELANDNPAYIPTRKAFAEGSYETVNSRVEPGSGEKMVEAAVRLLKQLAE